MVATGAGGVREGAAEEAVCVDSVDKKRVVLRDVMDRGSCDSQMPLCCSAEEGEAIGAHTEEKRDDEHGGFLVWLADGIKGLSVL